MKNTFLITTMTLVLSIVTGCSREEEKVSADQTGGEVIRETTQVVDQTPAQLDNTVVRESEEEVEYRTQREVTKTILHKENIPTVQTCRTKADINKMDKGDFQALGFDPQAADRIVQQREQQGQFRSVEDLSRIQGVSPDAFSQVRNDLAVGRQAQEEK